MMVRLRSASIWLSTMAAIKADIPAKLGFLFKPMRYKVAYGTNPVSDGRFNTNPMDQTIESDYNKTIEPYGVASVYSYNEVKNKDTLLRSTAYARETPATINKRLLAANYQKDWVPFISQCSTALLSRQSVNALNSSASLKREDGIMSR